MYRVINLKKFHQTIHIQHFQLQDIPHLYNQRITIYNYYKLICLLYTIF